MTISSIQTNSNPKKPHNHLQNQSKSHTYTLNLAYATKILSASLSDSFILMGKSLQSAAMLQKLSRVLNSSAKAHKPKQTQAKSPNSVASPPCGAIKLQSQPQPSLNSQSRIPLARVVADCTKRWFRDALDEAKDGDVSMQVIVGQMYNSGYGVRRDPNEGRAWIRQASISRRSSVWKASIKKPGYGASDSDSDEVENKAR